MKKTLSILFFVPLALVLIVELPRIANDPAFWTYRGAMGMITGALTITWMSLAVLLSTRKEWLEKKLGGLDKVYHLHKWVGIGALVFVVLHWIAETGVKKIGRSGLVELPPRIKAPSATPPSELSEFLKDMFQFLGEWAFYIGGILILIALFKKTISYKNFRLSHKIFPIIFVMGAAHALYFMPARFWMTPIGWLIVALTVPAIFYSFGIFSGKLGAKKQSTATIVDFDKKADGTLDLTLDAPQWQGHQAGQFLFIHFGDKPKFEGAHPFTIASAWDPNKKTIRLGIKPLGDFTKILPTLIQKGQSVRLEGPYGDFIFDENAEKPQLWVAGGVGVTPFIARLEDLAAKNQTANVDFFCSLRNENAHFITEMKELSAKTGVRLHLWLSEKEGKSLALSTISAVFKPDSKVYFCGPFMWGESLLNHLKEKGMPEQNFLRERFEFR